ncbi:glyoxalase family protein [Penicillium waksmanii]|uniref:glyoxalase family protein n=1 Tax=Penicillium waksmanii TaxID=69791 RepID=UPI0025470B8D|nr:glyoxalase family protein [Penicillium waksmanii]KAJ5973906.1 glyoxalase family protein [Penicillium waksmanii]
MVIDHMSLHVPEDKFRECLDFYLAALKPLGYTIWHQFGETVVGLGAPREDLKDHKRPDLWLCGIKTPNEYPSHIAFASSDRATVDAFYAEGIKAGAEDNGAPGLREAYHSNYYGAFLLDPVGNNIEAVHHGTV